METKMHIDENVAKLAYVMVRRTHKTNTYNIFLAAYNWLEAANCNLDDFGDYAAQYANDLHISPFELDMTETAIHYIVRVVRKASKSSSDDSAKIQAGLDDLLEAYEQYQQAFEIDSKRAGEILYQVPENCRSKAWEFLCNMTNAEEPKEPSLYFYADLEQDRFGDYTLTITDEDNSIITVLDHAAVQYLRRRRGWNITDAAALKDILSDDEFIPKTASIDSINLTQEEPAEVPPNH